MEVRIMNGTELYAVFDHTNYKEAVMMAESEDMDASVLSIHPDDIAPLQSLEEKVRIDELLRNNDVDNREMTVWASNLALLNLYLISKLVKVGESQWADAVPDGLSELSLMADDIISKTEDNTYITGLLGVDAIIAKSGMLSTSASDALKEIYANPEVPTLL